MTTPGTVIASVVAGAATDAAGNGNSASTSTDNTVTWDATAPTVTIDLRRTSDSGSSSTDDLTNAASLVFDLAFSETVTGLATNDFSNSGNGDRLHLHRHDGLGRHLRRDRDRLLRGTVIVRLRASAVLDTAGNPNAVTDGPTVTIDRTRPTVTINQLVGQPDPTNNSPILFAAVFSEATTDFATGDVTVGGTSGGTKVGSVFSGPTTFTIAVTGMTISGTVVATIPAGVATDAAGNLNFASTSVDNTVTWNRATHLGFVQQPTDTIYRSTIAPAVTVAVLDDNGFLVTESSALVTLSLLPAGPTLGGTLTVAAVNGLATFAGLSVDQVGSYTLDATSGGLLGATSATFDILPAPLTITANDRLKVYGQTVVFAGTEFSPAACWARMRSPASPSPARGQRPRRPSPAARTRSRPRPRSALASATTPSPTSTASLTVLPAALTITANDRLKTYGQTVVFAGTEFTTSGLLNADDVTSVTLTSAGAAPTATVAGSPYPITPSTAVGTGLVNYAISYVDGELTVNPAPLTITADDRTKTYGQTVVFAGSEFSASGLLNADAVTCVTLASAGAAATATVLGSPYSIAPSTAVGTGLGNYAITYVDGSSPSTPAALTVTADDRTKTYGQTWYLRRHGVHDQRPAQRGCGRQRDPDERRGRSRPPPSRAARTRSRRQPRSAAASPTTRSPTSTGSYRRPGRRGHRRHRLLGGLRRPAAHGDRDGHRRPWARTSRAASTSRRRPTPRSAPPPMPGRSATPRATTTMRRGRSTTRS